MDAGQPVRIQADQSQTLADGIVQFKESVRGGAHFLLKIQAFSSTFNYARTFSLYFSEIFKLYLSATLFFL